MRGTAAEFLAKYLLLEKGYEVADVLRQSAPQDIVFRPPTADGGEAGPWLQGQIKRAYKKSTGGLWVNTEKRDGARYTSSEIDYIVAVWPASAPAFWADLWLIPFEELLHQDGPYKGETKGRLKLTAERDRFKI